jgi:archaellum component FlaC
MSLDSIQLKQLDNNLLSNTLVPDKEESEHKTKIGKYFKFLKTNLTPILSLASIVVNVVLLSYTIPNLQSSLDAANSQLPNIQTQLNSFQRSSLQNNQLLYNLVNQTSELQGIISDVLTTYPKIQSDVSIVTSQVPTLQSTIIELQNNVLPLQDQVNGIVSNVNYTDFLFSKLIGDKEIIQNTLDQATESIMIVSELNTTIKYINQTISPLNQNFISSFTQDSNAFNKVSFLIESLNFLVSYQPIFNNISESIANLLLTQSINVTFLFASGYDGENPVYATFINSNYQPIKAAYGVTGFYISQIGSNIFLPGFNEVLVNTTTLLLFINGALVVSLNRFTNCSCNNAAGLNSYSNIVFYTSEYNENCLFSSLTFCQVFNN